MTSLRDAAIAYAEHGWQVFPVHGIGAEGRCTCGDHGGENCSPGKHPRTSHGFRDATDDVEQVERWWSRWPDANIGIATGESSGFWVLDVDVRRDEATGEVLKDGEATLRDLERANSALPTTLAAVTGGGGRHIYFAWDKDAQPVGCPKGPGLGLDVRGEGGYVIAPPSVHASGRPYTWERSPWIL